MSKNFRVAAVQMVSGTDPQQNLQRAAALVAEAAGQGAELIVLPEYFCLMGRQDGDKVAISEPYGAGPLQQALAALAREHGVWLVGGTVPLVSPQPGKVLNTLLLFAPDGSVAGRYDKIHLFGFTGQGERYCESDSIVAGSEPLKISTPLADIAFGICYDLRFPELFRQMAPFDLLVLPAAFTATPARRTGKCCCVRGPSKTNVMSWHPPRAARTKMAAARTARASSSTHGAASWRNSPRVRAWCWPILTKN